MKGSLISDNIILTEELMTFLNKKTRGSNVIIKIDMEKAFDRISWPYLMAIQQAFGFGERWIDWTWKIVSGNFFSILINGEYQGFFFKSTRDIR